MRFIELRATGSTLALTAKTFVSMFRTAVNHGTSFLSMGRPRAQLLIVFIFGGKRWGGRTRGIIEPFVTEMRRAEVVGPPAFICIAKVCKDVGRLPFWAVDVKLAAPSVTHPLTNWLHLEKTCATCSTKSERNEELFFVVRWKTAEIPLSAQFSLAGAEASIAAGTKSRTMSSCGLIGSHKLCR